MNSSPGGLGRLTSKALLLLGSGALSGLAIAAFASGKLPAIRSDVVSATLRLISLQVLAVTIGKWGGDSLAFAMASGDPNSGLNIRHRVLAKSLPVGLPVALCMFWVGRFPWSCVPPALLSVAADIIAIQLVADLNARGRVGTTAIAATLNYPLFVLCILLAGIAGSQPGLAAVVCAFAFTSLARLAWCLFAYNTIRPSRLVDSTADAALAGQQCLNVYAYRADQILVGALGLSRFGGSPMMEAFFLYMVRFPDLISSGVTALGPVYLPRVYAGDRKQWARGLLRIGVPYCLLAILALGLLAFIFSRLGNHGSGVFLLDVLPFALSATLGAPVYALSYSMIRSGSIPVLVKVLATAAAVGLALAALCLYFAVPRAIFWLVPAQLLTIVVGASLFEWGATDRTASTR